MTFQAYRKSSECDSEYERKVVSDIEESGWSIVAVFGDPDDPDSSAPLSAPFAYTVGLERKFEHPELVIFGLPPYSAGHFLNHMGQLIREGRRFIAGETCLAKDMGGRYDLRIQAVVPDYHEEYLKTASWFYLGREFRALQVVWPDRYNRFPDHPKFEKVFQDQQPLLAW